ncbi:F-box only protein 9 [Gracilariopsis chorda]|uniref:F-box only protein 9 n=1 Tax=Gracilariopsis chorda TaxID=448386 RepID=A0A2V3J0C4_9FLOR|nr:F-box only protein 9 [Gracilariopsis chorda]|eukprot:PXF46810.1 F-box only protein 9 [Gracilariopsis chorda]
MIATASRPWFHLYQTDFARLRSSQEKEHGLFQSSDAEPYSSGSPTQAEQDSECDSQTESKFDITSLPAEVLSTICSFLEAEQLCNLAQVNSALISHAYDPKHWRRIARETWPSECERELRKHLYSYKTWRLLCTQRPRLRTNALFVLQHQFTKTASRFAASEPQAPVFLVTYYRFLRFYTSGTVMSLTTPEAPHLAYRRVRTFHGRASGPDKDETRPLTGSYSFDESTRQVRIELPMKHHKFPNMRSGKVFMDFDLHSTTHGAYDRLYLRSHFAMMEDSDFGGDSNILYPCDWFEDKPFRLVPLLGFRDRIYREFPKNDDRDLAQWYEMKKAARAEQKNRRGCRS